MTLATVVGTDAARDEISRGGPGATTAGTTMVGDGSAGATIAHETVVGGRVTIASETSTGEIAEMIIGGAIIVSGTTT
jgi:hypothetical protein